MADDIAKMRAALTDGASVSVTGAPAEFENAKAIQTSRTLPSPVSTPSLDDISNFLQNLPQQAQRFITNPQAFTQAITGKNPLPEETGFAASATSLPPENPNSLFTPEGMAYNKGYETGEPYGIAAQAIPMLAPAVKPTAKMLAEIANEQVLNTGNIKLPMGLPDIPVYDYAVKPKGGNWADNRLDRVIDPLKFSIANTPMSQAINNWVESKLKKYIRNDLATPTDPLRELADQGITHHKTLNVDNPYIPNYITNQRIRQGFAPEGYSKTPMGKAWEAKVDEEVYPIGIKDFIGDYPATANRHPWMTDLLVKDPMAKINDLNSNAPVELGFDHLVDELHNSVNKYSDIPQHLRLKPEALDRITVPQAVQHVAKINDWRAEQMAKASKDSLKDFPIVHEGGDGYNIHELKIPEEPPINWRQDDEGRWISPEGKISNIDPRYEQLDKALKNEGQQMGHCVGGYTEEVARGDSRIFTLRDPKGGAHVTIEAIPKLHNWDEIPQEVKNAAEQVGEGAKALGRSYSDAMEAYIIKWMHANPKLQIEQIKGKSNGPVSEKYRGYIQEFLNNSPNIFSKVKDLENVGLADLDEFRKNPNWSHYATHALKPGELDALGFEFPDALMLKLKELFPNERFVTLEQIRDALNLPPIK